MPFSYLILFLSFSDGYPLSALASLYANGIRYPPDTHVHQPAAPGKQQLLLTQLARCCSSVLLINEVIKSKMYYFMLEPRLCYF